MSIYTGKYDFYDFTHMNSSPESLIQTNNLTLYVDKERVHIESEKDLFLYATYIIRTSVTSDKENKIVLCPCSYIDSEEHDHVAWYIKVALKFMRKHKKDCTEENLYQYLRKWFEFEDSKTLETVAYCAISEKKLLSSLPVKLVEDDISFMYNYLLPKYFSRVRTLTATRKRERFLKDAEEQYGLKVDATNLWPENILTSMYIKYNEFSNQLHYDPYEDVQEL